MEMEDCSTGRMVESMLLGTEAWQGRRGVGPQWGKESFDLRLLGAMLRTLRVRW